MTDAARNASRGRAARHWLLAATFIIFLQAGCSQAQSFAWPAADLLLLGDTVHDGSGEAPGQLDVAVTGERIVYVGTDAASRFRAAPKLDVTGQIVTPGFIDPHTHPDRYIRSRTPPNASMRRGCSRA